jgi:DNA-binding MarR family transcriptional regulator
VVREIPIRLGGGFDALAPGVDPLAVEVVLNLLRASVQIEAVATRVFAANEITSTAYGVLEVLANASEPITPTRISRRMLPSPKTLSHQLNTLEERGLPERRRHATDRRSVRIELAEAGRALVEDVTRALIPIDLDIAATLASADQELLIELLAAIQPSCTKLLTATDPKNEAC